MPPPQTKDVLQRYLRAARDAMSWKLDGVSECDARRPLTPTGTNLPGMVKHLAACEIGYFGATFDRRSRAPRSGCAIPVTIRRSTCGSPRRRRGRRSPGCTGRPAHADATVEALPLDAPGLVPWWGEPDVTLHHVLVRMIAETNRHAGHADVLRELLDGAVGMRTPATTCREAKRASGRRTARRSSEPRRPSAEAARAGAHAASELSGRALPGGPRPTSRRRGPRGCRRCGR
ncbi:DinB family protein [Saccharopolyspora halophila]